MIQFKIEQQTQTMWNTFCGWSTITLQQGWLVGVQRPTRHTG